MNKKVNTFLFLIAAMLCNLIILILLLGISYTLFFLIIPNTLNHNLVSFLIFAIFAAATISTFFIYNFFLNFISKKINMDKYFINLKKPRKK